MPILTRRKGRATGVVKTAFLIADRRVESRLKPRWERLTRQFDAILSRLAVLSLDAPMDDAYAAIRTHLERAGTPIGGNDLQIAAQARSLGLTVITANVGEFSRVPDLAIETWL
ncbi:PIN domain-containing protein [Pyruvatibacter mobilis]|uniref:PIN domain-containing protein n=1 Tax=Pyruvatibacter mobilis TaxID=1712261 RepID=UPI003BACC55D